MIFECLKAMRAKTGLDQWTRSRPNWVRSPPPTPDDGADPVSETSYIGIDLPQHSICVMNRMSQTLEIGIIFDFRSFSRKY
jgi:hypothetical protein